MANVADLQNAASDYPHKEPPMAKSTDTLYVGTGRFVAAIRPDDGTERWRTKIPSSMGNIVSLLPDGNRLYVGHAGRVYALDAGTGEILWEAPLKGTGHAAVMLTLPGRVAAAGLVIAAAQTAADAAAAAASAAI
jgi:outer membrane protein assembly factor BamB